MSRATRHPFRLRRRLLSPESPRPAVRALGCLLLVAAAVVWGVALGWLAREVVRLLTEVR